MRFVEKTFSKKNLSFAIIVISLPCSPGRSSPSFQLLVMNPGFFMHFAKVRIPFRISNTFILSKTAFTPRVSVILICYVSLFTFLGRMPPAIGGGCLPLCREGVSPDKGRHPPQKRGQLPSAIFHSGVIFKTSLLERSGQDNVNITASNVSP